MPYTGMMLKQDPGGGFSQPRVTTWHRQIWAQHNSRDPGRIRLQAKPLSLSPKYAKLVKVSSCL